MPRTNIWSLGMAIIIQTAEGECYIAGSGVVNTFRNLENLDALEQAKNHQRMKRMGKPSEVADVALWLCSDQSSFITGSSIKADGGALC